MMLQEFLQLLPDELGSAALGIAVGGSVVGALLWLAGGKFSRPLVTLLTVLIGAAIGMRLPAWFNWNVSGAGPAVGGAVLLGVSGFALHRMWVGIGLGIVLGSWSTFAIWIAMHDGKPLNWPDVAAKTTLLSYLKDVWHQVPPNIARVLPFAASASVITGVAAAILWPKLTTVLNWSSAGVSLIAGMGIAAIAYRQPSWLKYLPARTLTQVVVLVLLIAIGAALQWRLTPATLFAGAGEGESRGGGEKKSSKKSKRSASDED